MTTNWKKKIAGFLPTSEGVLATMQKHVEERDALAELMGHPRWPIMQRILNGFYEQAVQKLGKENFEELDWLRINHRVEILKEIQAEINSIIERGDAAREQLQKNKEKQDARRTNPDPGSV